MKRARRFPLRLVRWTSLWVCFALVLSCLAIVPFASATGKSRRGPDTFAMARIDPHNRAGTGGVDLLSTSTGVLASRAKAKEARNKKATLSAKNKRQRGYHGYTRCVLCRLPF